MVTVAHQWNPDDWESFALSLLQSRHGALNVHKIPAKHKGDLGIDFYCTGEAVIYQCFAAEEPIDVATRANRQKKKITTDLKKIVGRKAEVSKLFMGIPVKKWVLLAPIHDSKDVNLHCAKKTTDLRILNLSHLDAEFEVCIQDQESFPGALSAAIAALTNISLSVDAPSAEELSAWQAGSRNLLANATKKLAKRTGPDGVQPAVAQAVEAFLRGNALMDALRASAPDMHEKVIAAVTHHASRLNLAGPQGGPEAGAILHSELTSLTASIKDAAPSLSNSNAQEIAMGVISDWIMRCSLDFPANAA